MMCSIDIENNEVLISSIFFYNEKENEYIAIEDVVKKVEMPFQLILISQLTESLDF